jgi:hypothetical protein
MASVAYAAFRSAFSKRDFMTHRALGSATTP